MKTRAVEIHCCVVGCVGEKDLTVRITVPEPDFFARGEADELATAYAASLALVWGVTKEEIQTSVTIVQEERMVEQHYDLSMMKRRR